MSTSEDVRFDIQSKKFNNEISQYDVRDERAWSILGIRQFEIMDSEVNNARKLEAFDRVLWEISRIFPRADNAYLQALERRFIYADKKNQADLRRMADHAYDHRRDADFERYGKFMYEIYKRIKDKDNFPYKSIAKAYRKKQLRAQNDAEKENREKILAELSFYADSEFTSPLKKIDYIDEMIDLIEEKYFGKSRANDERAKCCDWAAQICRRELLDEDLAQYYLGEKKNYERLADNARNHWKGRRGLLTDKDRETYMQKYRTDRGRE